MGKCRYLTLARPVAYNSHAASSISPSGSISFTPLSSTGLCDAVIITPTDNPAAVRPMSHLRFYHVILSHERATLSQSYVDAASVKLHIATLSHKQTRLQSAAAAEMSAVLRFHQQCYITRTQMHRPSPSNTVTASVSTEKINNWSSS